MDKPAPRINIGIDDVIVQRSWAAFQGRSPTPTRSS